MVLSPKKPTCGSATTGAPSQPDPKQGEVPGEARGAARCHGRRLGSPPLRHLVFSAHFVLTRDVSSIPKWVSLLIRDTRRPSGWGPSPLSQSKGQPLWGRMGTGRAPLRAKGRSQGCNERGESGLGTSCGPCALPFMAALSDPSLMQDFARERIQRKQSGAREREARRKKERRKP